VASGKNGRNSDRPIINHQGITRESHHAFLLGPRLVVDSWIVDDIVCEMRSFILCNQTDLQLAHRDAAMGAINVGVHASAGLHLQYFRIFNLSPDPC